MKIKLTESQLKKAKLITEGQQVVHTFLKKADDIKETVNRMYSKLTFTTLAEIIDGDIDLDVMKRKLEQLRTIMYTYSKKSQMFFDNMSTQEYENNREWEDLQAKAEDAFQEVTYHKIDVLEELIDSLSEFSAGDIDKNFKDIKKIDL